MFVFECPSFSFLLLHRANEIKKAKAVFSVLFAYFDLKINYELYIVFCPIYHTGDKRKLKEDEGNTGLSKRKSESTDGDHTNEPTIIKPLPLNDPSGSKRTELVVQQF